MAFTFERFYNLCFKNKLIIQILINSKRYETKKKALRVSNKLEQTLKSESYSPHNNKSKY